MSIFSKVSISKPKSSRQNLTHENLLSSDFGKIIPFYLEDVVPGDKIHVQTEAQLKLIPTLAPIMTDIEVRMDYFFVPNRLLWDDWSEFITGGAEGTSTPAHPYIEVGTIRDRSEFGLRSLSDYFGLPVDIPRMLRGNPSALAVPEGVQVDALPFRAYAMIWNEYYRDQNLQDEIVISKAAGEDTDTNTGLLYRGLKKDYFTSALPWTQRGPSVDIPISGSAPVSSSGGKINFAGATDDAMLFTPAFEGSEFSVGSVGHQLSAGLHVQSSDAAFLEGRDTYSDPTSNVALTHHHAVDGQFDIDSVSGLNADLSEASAITINELRRLSAVQRWLEKNARAGSRYVEQILSHFGVRVPDYRLDRPEYLGGNKSVLGMAEVFQTSQTDSTPQGNRAGVGYGASFNRSRKFRVEEHGWVIGLMSIVPRKNLYCDGIQKKWRRFDKFDYYFPAFQFLGEQQVDNIELYAYANSGLSDAFGYQKRYAEYKYHPSGIHGDMRASLAYWHLGRMFNDTPYLNSDFISSESEFNNYDRIFPVESEENGNDRFFVRLVNHVRMRRPMYYDPEPSL